MVDLSGLKAIDARFFGFLLMVRKQVLEHGGHLHLSGAPPRIKRAFRLHRFEFLLGPNAAVTRGLGNVEVSSPPGNV